MLYNHPLIMARKTVSGHPEIWVNRDGDQAVEGTCGEKYEWRPPAGGA